MFNRLPPELVRQIIESAIPSASLSSNYDERQVNLRSFCLVCRYLRQETQPLLFQYILAERSPHTLNEALKFAQSKGWTRCIRQASIKGSGSLLPMKSRFERLARNGQGLRVLTLANLEEMVNLALLTQLPQLRDLRLFGKSFKINSRFVLPNLESLTMDHASMDTLLPRLRPASLPALRNLAYSDNFPANCLSEFLQSKLFRQLLEQVDPFSVDSLFIPSSALNDFQPFFRKTLVSVCPYHRTLDSRLILRVEHVRFRSYSQFVGWAQPIYDNKIKLSNFPLRSLYLDAGERHKTVGLRIRGVMRQYSVNQLFPGVDIVYEEREDSFESIISKEFVARQRRRNTGQESG